MSACMPRSASQPASFTACPRCAHFHGTTHAATSSESGCEVECIPCVWEINVPFSTDSWLELERRDAGRISMSRVHKLEKPSEQVISSTCVGHKHQHAPPLL